MRIISDCNVGIVVIALLEKKGLLISPAVRIKSHLRRVVDSVTRQFAIDINVLSLVRTVCRRKITEVHLRVVTLPIGIYIIGIFNCKETIEITVIKVWLLQPLSIRLYKYIGNTFSLVQTLHSIGHQ